MELQFSGTNGDSAQLTMKALEALFRHLELPFDFSQSGSTSDRIRKPKPDLLNDFAYRLPSFPKNENRTTLNFFCPAIR